MSEQSAFQVVEDSRFERLLLTKVCEPIVERLPRGLTPNTISIGNHLVAWAGVVLVAAATFMEPAAALMARTLAAMTIVVNLVMDCLDGMHARRTGQCSRMGELMDHGLDAANVPLNGAVVILAFQLDPLLLAVAFITTAGVYNAQLIYYYHKGDFVPPQVGGPSAQATSAAAVAGLALLFYWFGRDAQWIDWGVTAFVIGVIGVNFRLIYWYLSRLGGAAFEHMALVVRMGVWFVPFAYGLIDEFTFIALATCTSFRVTGRYVLGSITKTKHNGWDWQVAATVPFVLVPIMAIDPIVLVGNLTLQALLPAAACSWIILMNIRDVRRHQDSLA